MLPAVSAPLVLLHGVTMSGSVWDPLRPYLEDHHVVHTPTLLGHRGGNRPPRRPVRFTDVVDDVERQLDALRLDRPHLAGNSLGGWAALELARRGRAASVCALAPAGFWEPGARGRIRALEQAARLARLTRYVAPLGLSVPLVRRLSFAGVAEHGERMTAAQARRATRDLLGCTVLDELLTDDAALAPLPEPGCPVHVAWSEHDRLFPPERFAGRVAAVVPGASTEVLPGLGHVPMIDDPAAVAALVLRTTGGASDG